MQCSSLIGALAAALAQAQSELTNPERCAHGRIEQDGREIQFAYAPLSIGLDIVRTTLGRHKIAVTQTTHLDRGLGLVTLNTALVHGSGEWISSEWPVCRLSDMAAPRRMGAALTYARRYALFAIVGIAGDCDLDSLELSADIQRNSVPGAIALPRRTETGIAEADNHNPSKPTTDDEARVEQASLIIDEIEQAPTADALRILAPTLLKRKARLRSDAARRIEEAFAMKLSALEARETPTPESGKRPSTSQSIEGSSQMETSDASYAPGKVNKSVLALGEPRRRRDKRHLRYVASLPCLVCGRTPSDPHHVRFAQPRALGLKASDEFTVPLCRIHHRENHRTGDERAWWQLKELRPLEAAAILWAQTRKQANAEIL